MLELKIIITEIKINKIERSICQVLINILAEKYFQNREDTLKNKLDITFS
jgi:hypothetical protein